jgi:ribonuclease HI
MLLLTTLPTPMTASLQLLPPPTPRLGLAACASRHLPLTRPHCALRAVRWALCSAHAAENAGTPFLAVFAVPHWRNAAYTQHFRHPNLTFVSAFSSFPYVAPPHMPFAYRPDPSPRSWDMCVFAVSNAAGARTLNVRALAAALRASLPLPALSVPAPRTASKPLPCHAPHGFLAVAAHPPVLPAHTPPPPAGWLPPEFPITHPLQYRWDQAIYTDGSCTRGEGGNRLGAAFFHAGAGQMYLIDPNGEGATKTITRAELAAISQALRHVAELPPHPTTEPPPLPAASYIALLVEVMNSQAPLPPPTASHRRRGPRDVVICSDSQCSLHLIRRILYSPDTLRENIHLDLLKVIRQHLLACINAGYTVTFAKVKAHAGILGNECADVGAAQAARPDAVHYSREEAANDSRSQLAWPAYTADAGPAGTRPAPPDPAPQPEPAVGPAPPGLAAPLPGAVLAATPPPPPAPAPGAPLPAQPPDPNTRTYDFSNLTTALKAHLRPRLGAGLFPSTVYTTLWSGQVCAPTSTLTSATPPCGPPVSLSTMLS